MSAFCFCMYQRTDVYIRKEATPRSFTARDAGGGDYMKSTQICHKNAILPIIQCTFRVNRAGKG